MASQPQSSASYSSTLSALTPVPRAAVSVVVRYNADNDAAVPPQYLLIERGNPPNKGVWCVPGGKIDMGEPTLLAAQRELAEEVKFPGNNDNTGSSVQLNWYSGAFCTSDSITAGNVETGKEGYHFLIAQCFAELTIIDKDDDNSQRPPPMVEPADDAAGAKWWTLKEIRTGEANHETVPNLVKVIERAEALYQCGMLPTTHSVTTPTP